MHIGGVNISASKIKDLTKVAERFYTVSEVLNVLARIKNTPIDSKDHLEMAATILEKIHSDGNQDYIHPLWSFTAEHFVCSLVHPTVEDILLFCYVTQQ